ncbi:hypothetical protein [Nocardia sp. alder85J]|uniref:hypothetical protein n=1 Tax=Nocardia sp. alder85J TaxID=2862949 RepID=UPI001CD271C8|nr:hypothetical protein [Nocardia sp. alder85J]MCX4093901.1 hypothetical protein [Nocardia sp. alder85J]
MIVLIGLIVLVIGATGLGLLLVAQRGTARRGTTARRALEQSPWDATVSARDCDEHAGGSRHVRTTPSRRDHLERWTAAAPEKEATK